MRVGNALRHAAEIEHCLKEEELEELVLAGPLSPSLDAGGKSGAERVYTIADNGRVEMIDAPIYEQRLYDLLPADTDAVIVIDEKAMLYTVELTRMEFEGRI